MSFFDAGGFPVNYFGKGEHWELPPDEAVQKEFTQRFLEYEVEHPDDPTGEIAFAEYKRKYPFTGKTIPSIVEQKTFAYAPEPVEPYSENLRLQIPPSKLQTLKNYAHYRRRRPRDILIEWIDKYCKL